MELLRKNKEWFLSKEGEEKFFALSSVEERATFFYSYLTLVLHSALQRNNNIFKLAFFLADAVYSSDEPYAKYPSILNESENPFLSFFANLDFCPENEVLFVVQMAILNGKVDCGDQEEWIYDKDFLISEEFLDHFVATDKHYYPSYALEMIDLSIFSKKKETLQAELAWLYLS